MINKKPFIIINRIKKDSQVPQEQLIVRIPGAICPENKSAQSQRIQY